jgi:hypothetical protein
MSSDVCEDHSVTAEIALQEVLGRRPGSANTQAQLGIKGATIVALLHGSDGIRAVHTLRAPSTKRAKTVSRIERIVCVG